DQRIAVGVNRSGESTVVSRCRHCGELSDRYVNCAWPRCNRQHFCCARCEVETRRYCGQACEQAALVSLAATAIESD
ncbi:MAG: hypothetical protein GWO24_12640, partial [Akkermansiaceae bacterium]|nr:hypothetical protein [Akkermansiaceae bacterium]